jgi:predicted membrane protein
MFMSSTSRGGVTAHLVFGLIIMFVGVILALDVLDLVNARDILRYWPVALLAFGVADLTQANDRASRLRGTFLTFFGGFWLLTTLRVLPSHSWRLFWPLLLVIAGAALVAQTMQRQADPRRGASSQRVNIIGILGGGNRTSNANPFRGGDLMAFMGGGQVDLRRAVIPPGEEAIIEVMSMMGGFEIIVPDTWAVDDRTVPIMGGVGNETRFNGHPGVTPPTLILRGVLFMGGVNIRN